MPTIINGDGVVTAGGTASTQGRVVLAEQTGSGTNTVTIQAPATLAADLTFTMPTADGTNGQVLQTNGSGTLSFVNQTTPTSLATPLTVIGDATAGAEIRLPEDTDNGANYVALKAPNALASNLTLTLPSADGTNGQVLQTNGSGTLSFATPAAGALVFLSSQTVSGTPLSVDFTSGINSTYDDYFITFENVSFTSVGGNNAALSVRLQQSGSFQTGSTYDWGLFGVGSSTAQAENAISDTKIILTLGSSSTRAQAVRAGFVYLLNVNSTALYGNSVLATGTTRDFANTNSTSSTCGGTSKTQAVITGIQFISNNGIVFTSGTFRLYGIAKS